jgi:hypothetical protein
LFYNTLKGAVSSVGNDVHVYGKSPVPFCGQELFGHISIPKEEWFDVSNCCNVDLSPCRNGISYQFPSAPRNDDDETPQNVTVILAEKNENCDVSCKKANLRCSSSSYAVGKVNTCTQVKHFFPGYNCIIGDFPGPEQPAFDTIRKVGLLFKCIPSIFKCNASYYSTIRICPCV